MSAGLCPCVFGERGTLRPLLQALGCRRGLALLALRPVLTRWPGLARRRILDADEQLEWALFYYSGAARTAGLSYSGAVLATRNGAMPTSPAALSRLETALDLAGIKMWELSLVDNTDLSGAPLSMANAA